MLNLLCMSQPSPTSYRQKDNIHMML